MHGGESNDCFIQVAAFRATLEEISESSLLVHVVDIRYNIFKLRLSLVSFVFSWIYQLTLLSEVQPSPGRAADRCCGKSSFCTWCVCNSEVNGLEQGSEIFSISELLIIETCKRNNLTYFPQCTCDLYNLTQYPLSAWNLLFYFVA